MTRFTWVRIGGICTPKTGSRYVGLAHPQGGSGYVGFGTPKLGLSVWDGTNNLQDKVNRRNINADDKLRKMFGKDQITMFELAGILSKHLK